MRFCCTKIRPCSNYCYCLAALNLFMAMFTVEGCHISSGFFLGQQPTLRFCGRAMAVGSIMGGLLAGAVTKKVRFNGSSKFLLALRCAYQRRWGLRIWGMARRLLPMAWFLWRWWFVCVAQHFYGDRADIYSKSNAMRCLESNGIRDNVLYLQSYPLGQAMAWIPLWNRWTWTGGGRGGGGHRKPADCVAARRTIKRFSENNGHAESKGEIMGSWISLGWHGLRNLLQWNQSKSICIRWLSWITIRWCPPSIGEYVERDGRFRCRRWIPVRAWRADFLWRERTSWSSIFACLNIMESSFERYLRNRIQVDVIVVTAAKKTDALVSSLHLGAVDYLVKPFFL